MRPALLLRYFELCNGIAAHEGNEISVLICAISFCSALLRPMRLLLVTLSIFALSRLPIMNAQQGRFEQQPLRAVPFRQAAPVATPKPTPKVFVALPNYNEETA